MARAVRIATWNVENLFRPGDSASAPDEKTYSKKVDALAATISRIDPDVVAFQEVGSRAALEDVLGRVGGTWHTELADPDHRGIGVALTSRVALTGTEQIRGFPTRIRPVQVDDTAPDATGMGRPGLHAVTDTGVGQVHVLTCHLKSKLLTYPGGRFSPTDEHEHARYGAYALFRRTAEAATIRDAATEILTVDPAAALVVLGDMNDEPTAQTTQILQGPPGSEIGTAGYDHPDAGDAQRLWNLADRIPIDQRFSRVYRGRRELIDHIFLSHALVDRAPAGSVDTTASGSVDSVDDNPNPRRTSVASDHRPVVVTFS